MSKPVPEAILEAVLDHIAEGGMLLGPEGICGKPLPEDLRAATGRANWPSWRTLMRRRRDDPAFAQRYERAYQASAEALEQQALIEAGKAHDKDSAAAARVRIAQLQWSAGKRSNRYGERVSVDHSGQIGVTNLSDDQLNRKLAELLGKAGLPPEQAARLGVEPIAARLGETPVDGHDGGPGAGA